MKFWALGHGQRQRLPLRVGHVEAVDQHDGFQPRVGGEPALRRPGGKPTLRKAQSILIGAVLLLKGAAGGENRECVEGVVALHI